METPEKMDMGFFLWAKNDKLARIDEETFVPTFLGLYTTRSYNIPLILYSTYYFKSANI